MWVTAVLDEEFDECKNSAERDGFVWVVAVCSVRLVCRRGSPPSPQHSGSLPTSLEWPPFPSPPYRRRRPDLTNADQALSGKEKRTKNEQKVCGALMRFFYPHKHKQWFRLSPSKSERANDRTGLDRTGPDVWPESKEACNLSRERWCPAKVLWIYSPLSRVNPQTINRKWTQTSRRRAALVKVKPRVNKSTSSASESTWTRFTWSPDKCHSSFGLQLQLLCHSDNPWTTSTVSGPTGRFMGFTDDMKSESQRKMIK